MNKLKDQAMKEFQESAKADVEKDIRNRIGKEICSVHNRKVLGIKVLGDIKDGNNKCKLNTCCNEFAKQLYTILND